MRIYLFLLLVNSFSAFAQFEGKETSPTHSPDSVRIKKIKHLLTEGSEKDVREYFKNTWPTELPTLVGTGTIASSINQLPAKARVSRTLWILDEVRSLEPAQRRYVYQEFLNTQYVTPNLLVKTMINSFFSNYRETNDSLCKQISQVQFKMIK